MNPTPWLKRVGEADDLIISSRARGVKDEIKGMAEEDIVSIVRCFGLEE